MVKFRLEEGISLPKYETPGAAGFDVVAYSIMKAFKGNTKIIPEKLDKMKEGFEKRGYIKIRPFERILFSTGLILADMSNDIELQIRSRSGISLTRGLFVANQPGTVDADYRGIIGVIIYNSTPFLNKVKKGERIAQIVPKEVIEPEMQILEEVTKTNRGSEGFGSTGEIKNNKNE